MDDCLWVEKRCETGQNSHLEALKFQDIAQLVECLARKNKWLASSPSRHRPEVEAQDSHHNIPGQSSGAKSSESGSRI